MLEELAEVDLPDLDLGSDVSLIEGEGDVKETIGAATILDEEEEEISSELQDSEDDETPELVERQKWIDDTLSKIHSIDTVNFELCLMEGSNTQPFDDVFIPALKRSISLISRKTSHIKLCIDVFGISDKEDDGYSRAEEKTEDILACFPPKLLTAISLNGAYLGNASGQIATAVNSPHLGSLTLQSTSGQFSGWQPAGLRKLHMAWGGDQADSADFELALPIIKASSSTLEVLGL